MKELDRKKYAKPAMRVYPLKNHPRLLQASGEPRDPWDVEP